MPGPLSLSRLLSAAPSLRRGLRGAPRDQRSINERAWEGAGAWTVRVYARSAALRPAEAAIFAAYRDALAGRTLELGCGAGRVTAHLIALGGDVQGLDIAPTMARHCQRRFPAARFTVGDMRDLSAFADGSYEAVVAAYNVIDVFDDADRRAALAEIRRALAPRGLLVLSAHNLAYAEAGGIGGPTAVRRGDPARMLYDAARVPLRVRNYRRARPFERREGSYAVLSDEGMNYAGLHYYIGRAAQEAQLAACGFEPLSCYDAGGLRVPAGESAPASPDLHYVARVARA